MSSPASANVGRKVFGRPPMPKCEKWLISAYMYPEYTWPYISTSVVFTPASMTQGRSSLTFTHSSVSSS